MKDVLDIKRWKDITACNKNGCSVQILRSQNVEETKKSSTTFNRLQIVVTLCRTNLMLQMVTYISGFKTNWS